jgi:NADPH-dependent 2,4-dienoyl-CoA reductase/sulfur reductase-like enzyme
VTDAIGADVVVVGGGPAGLSAATHLARLGAGKVILLERDTVVGGIPRHCGHSPFGTREFHRLLNGKRYVRRLEKDALAAGVEIRISTSVLDINNGSVRAATPDGLVEFQAKRIMLATGNREKPRSQRLVSGERPLGIINTGALQAYVYLEKLVPFKRPVIIGTELVAMSAILTCRSASIAPVAVIEKSDRPTVRFPFHLLPKVLGIPVHYSTEILGIHGRGRVEEIEISVGGEKRSIACDGVLFTGDFTPESALARMSGLSIDPASGGPLVDAYGRTSDPHVFAAGNLLRPVETAGWCWEEGRRVARAVFADLQVGGPAPTEMVRIRAGQGIKYAVPQQFGRYDYSRALDALQVHVTDRVRGRLALYSGSNIIWSRRLVSGPERRILIPIAELDLPASVSELTISVEK